MRLLKFTLSGFRRFEKEATINVEDKLVAIVGRNEAGKSSLLDALELINASSPFEIPPTKTRHISVVPTVKAWYRLDADDRALIAGIHEGHKVGWIEITRSADHDPRWRLDEPPFRDLAPRQESLAAAQAVVGDPALDNAFTTETAPWDDDRFARVLAALESGDETLTDDALAEVDAVVACLQQLRYPSAPDEDEEPWSDDEVERRAATKERRDSLRNELARLLVHEREPTPAWSVIDALKPRVPRVLNFSEEDRDLGSDYELTEVASSPPAALRNLARLAGLDLVEILRLAQERDNAQAVYLLGEANARLKDDFEENYVQSDVAAFLHLNGTRLEIHVDLEGGGGRSDIAQRSDGLRMFAALRAFVAGTVDPKPILLIDEVENHLHYDAQADLIDVFDRQKLAAKIIYTTHSVGCLPPDLGSGIRAVVPIEGSERSTINNSFWTRELRRRARTGSAIDALVVAVAEPGGTVLTGDSADITTLAGHADDVAVEVI
jgi:predicted ATPase